MGKSRRNRGKTARKDPIAKPVKAPSDPELAALRESKILPVIRDLQSADPKSRSAAASAISNIIQDSRCRKLLLREQVVHTVLTQTLTDSALESRAAGWGILRLLAEAEEADFCIYLYRSDIITALEYASKLVSDKLDPKFQKLSKTEQSTILSIASSIASLSTALAEAQDDILETISDNSFIVALLFKLIVSAQGDSEAITNLRSDALACLMMLTEDNDKLSERIVTKHSDIHQTLQTLKDDVSGDGVLACGILHNIFMILQDFSSEHSMVDDSALIPTLSKAVAAISTSSSYSNGAGWSNPIEYQQLSLEILASIGESLNSTQTDDPRDSNPNDFDEKDVEEVKEDEEMELDEPEAEEDVEGEESEEDDDDMDEDEMLADMDMITGVDNDAAVESMDDLPILKSLLQLAIPQLIRTAALQASDEDAMKLQGLALSALNNIAWSVSLIDFADEHNAGIKKAWIPVGQSIWEYVIARILSSDTADITLATQVTGLAWAVSRSLQAQTPIKSDEHRKFISLYQATRGSEATQNQDDPFQGLGVKCIGVLGELARDPAPTDLNREIGTFLITVLAALPETPAADAVEALDQIFDIYGNEDYAYDKEVFWRDNFIKHLDEVLPKAKNMVKTVDKRSHTELRSRADEAVLNLSRFVSYKKKSKP